MIAERNSLIDDLSWYKAKVSRLERIMNDSKKVYKTLLIWKINKKLLK